MTNTISDHEIIQNAISLVHEGLRVTFPVKGNSMLPFIIGGRESVDLVKPVDLRVGHVVLAWVDGCRYVVHRIIRIEGTQVTLMGDGNLKGTEKGNLSEVLGVVDQIISPSGRCRKPGNGRLWRRLLPVRKYLLKVYRKWNKIFA
jgi:hypothetical protein